MNAVGLSVIGMCRENNEDAIYISEEEFPLQNLFVVADGMGGCNAGDIASQCAIESFLDYVREQAKKERETYEYLDLLVGGIAACNQVVYHKSLESEKLNEMGTTFVAAVIEEKHLYVAHVGDSRAYIYHDKALKQITTDHSYVMELVKAGNITVEEAAVHPQRNIITRAVGSKELVESDTVIEELEAGDLVLLCTDGLSNMLSSEDMAEILQMEESLEKKAQLLVDQANAKGGLDNISLVLIEE